jgi:hypothetical protein
MEESDKKFEYEYDDCHSALKSPVDKNHQKIDNFEVKMNLKLKSLNNMLENNLNFYSRIIKNQARVEINKDFALTKHLKTKLDDLMSFRQLQFEIEYEQHLNILRDLLNKKIDEMRSEESKNYTNEIVADDLKIFHRKSQQIRRNLLRKYKLPMHEMSNSSLSRSQTNFSIKSSQSDISNSFKLPPIDTKEFVAINIFDL